MSNGSLVIRQEMVRERLEDVVTRVWGPRGSVIVIRTPFEVMLFGLLGRGLPSFVSFFGSVYDHGCL